MHLPTRLRSSFQALTGIVSCLVSCCFASEPDFLIDVPEPGHYEIPFDDFLAVGLQSSGVHVDHLGLFFSSTRVPFRIAGGEDGHFGAGDSLSFKCPGMDSSARNFSRFYRLALSIRESRQDKAPRSLESKTVLEEDLIRSSFPDGRFEFWDSWYWASISCLDEERFAIEIPKTESVTLHVRGATHTLSSRELLPDHELRVFHNGNLIHTERWNGTLEHEIECKVPPGHLDETVHRFELEVPKRYTRADKAIVADIVCLNRITLSTVPPNREKKSVSQVTHRKLSGLKDTTNSADILIVSASAFIDKAERMVQLYRAEGLEPRLVDLSDVYAEFNAGMPHADAVRDFLKFAKANWGKPELRFVLLVGDASSDPAVSTKDPQLLVPTYLLPYRTAIIASDNVFACVEGDDYAPDIAIGRFPVRTIEELDAMIDKCIACRRIESPDGNPSTLWISGAEDVFKRKVDRAIEWARGEHPDSTHFHLFLESRTVDQNKAYRQRILEQFGAGYTSGVFMGHGGAQWWRTGVPDFSKGTDLCSVHDFKRLPQHSYLPIMVGLTCVSAPFHQSSGPSLGEELVTMPRKGTACFIGTSWRTPASVSTAGNFFDALARSDTAGQAVQLAKRRMKRIEAEVYTLLGDPAFPLRRGQSTAE